MDIKTDKPAEKISRRRLLEIGLKTSAGILSQHPHIIPFISDSVSRTVTTNSSKEALSSEFPKIKTELSEKIRNWVLPDRARIFEILPLSQEASEVYKSINLEAYIPSANNSLSLRYDPSEINGSLKLTPIWDNESSVKIRCLSPKIPVFEMPIYKAVEAEIVLPFQVRGLYAERLLGIKEASQLVDFYEYAKRYVKILIEQGASFEVINPENKTLTTEFINTSIALGQMIAEFDKTGMSWFRDLVDFGSFLRVGGLGFIDWYLNYPQEMSKVPKVFLDGGHQFGGYLQQAGLVKFEAKHAAWKTGRPPEIASEEFMIHFNKITGR